MPFPHRPEETTYVTSCLLVYSNQFIIPDKTNAAIFLYATLGYISYLDVTQSSLLLLARDYFFTGRMPFLLPSHVAHKQPTVLISNDLLLKFMCKYCIFTMDWTSRISYVHIGQYYYYYYYYSDCLLCPLQAYF